jgi:peroxiredoxin
MSTRALLPCALVLLALAPSCRSTEPEPDSQSVATAAAAPNTTGANAFVPLVKPVDTAPVSTGTEKAELGAIAPDFELPDANGKLHRLSHHRGKIVVLEWFDPQCPFVTYAYDQGPLAEMRTRCAAAGIVWLGVYSTSTDHAVQAPGLVREFATRRKLVGPILIDAGCLVGRSFGARTTPELFVINERGALVYAGALDNAPMGRVERAAAKTNYVEAALDDLRSGHAVTTRSTRPYGTALIYARP